MSLFKTFIVLLALSSRFWAPISGSYCWETDDCQTQRQADLYEKTGQALSLNNVYLPLVVSSPGQTFRVNAPFFDGSQVEFEQTAILWFGEVNLNDNYADVRVGYTPNGLYIHVAVVDRLLWYDPTPSPKDLTAWDAVSLYLNVNGNTGSDIGPGAYLLDGQLNWWEARGDYQAMYRGDGSGWVPAAESFTTTTGWAGYPQPNDIKDDRGWWITYEIPFESLGFSGPPPQGTIWGLAFVLHDRDDAAGTAIPDQTWPREMNSGIPSTWGQLRLGLPQYSPPGGTVPGETYTIRHGLNNVAVADGMVGGSSICGEGLDFWTEWGQKNYAGAEQVNVQNEYDIADWPCYSKFYLTFPFDSLPKNSAVISATLTLHSIGNAGGGQWGDPSNSFVQVLTVAENWDEASLAWNNAPQAVENVAGIWVPPIIDWPGWPGVARTWDVSYAANLAYSNGQPLRIVLYSSDGNYNTGRYFSSSDVGDWDAVGRPTLTITLSRP